MQITIDKFEGLYPPTPPTPPTPEEISIRKWLLGVEPAYLPMVDDDDDYDKNLTRLGIRRVNACRL